MLKYEDVAILMNHDFSNIIFLYVIIFLINLLVIDEFLKMIKKIHIKKISKFLTMLIVLMMFLLFQQVEEPF